MDNHIVKVSDIRPGITITEDVFANTSFPIVKKNTKLQNEHLEVLRAFGIRTVKIEELIVKKEELINPEKIGTLNPDEVLSHIKIEHQDIRGLYNDAVTSYLKEFASWRAGLKPDIAKIRTIIIPLLEVFLKQKKMLTLLHDLSNPKDYLAHHAIGVGIIAAAISKRLDFPAGQTLQIGLAATLADCGMAKVNPAILQKAAFLTKEEFNEVKKHVVHSYQMVKDTPLLRDEMKVAIFQHHERLDGSGYPRGSKFEEISIIAQILSVADVFHAMTSERLYRSKESPFKVVEIIIEEGFGQFDIKIVQALHQLVGDLSIGSKVILTNGKEGEVIFVHRDASLRPMIKMNNINETILDLTTNRHLAIERILS